MSVERRERNALIVKLWNEGKSNQEILTVLRRAGYKGLVDTHSLSGVIARLKRRGRLKIKRPQLGWDIDKVVSKQVNKTASQQVYKRATFYIEPSTLKALKFLALRGDKNLSEVVREAFFLYLSKQSDL